MRDPMTIHINTILIRPILLDDVLSSLALIFVFLNDDKSENKKNTILNALMN